MLNEMRGAFFLFVSLGFFIVILGMLALGMVMKPSRWIERLRHVS